eukprot:COSAG01_NODE_26206_length_721_cov_0.739550_1_plen_145_part_10
MGVEPWSFRNTKTKILDVQICHLTQFAVVINLDDCADPMYLLDPCNLTDHQAQCVDGTNSYTCICSRGWEGPRCNFSVDDCHAQAVADGRYTNATARTHDNTYGRVTQLISNGSNISTRVLERGPCPYNNSLCIDGHIGYNCSCS